MNALRVTIALDDDNNVVAADSKAEFTRISTVNSMPESELAGYPTMNTSRVTERPRRG